MAFPDGPVSPREMRRDIRIGRMIVPVAVGLLAALTAWEYFSGINSFNPGTINFIKNLPILLEHKELLTSPEAVKASGVAVSGLLGIFGWAFGKQVIDVV